MTETERDELIDKLHNDLARAVAAGEAEMDGHATRLHEIGAHVNKALNFRHDLRQNPDEATLARISARAGELLKPAA